MLPVGGLNGQLGSLSLKRNSPFSSPCVLWDRLDSLEDEEDDEDEDSESEDVPEELAEELELEAREDGIFKTRCGRLNTLLLATISVHALPRSPNSK